MTAASRGEAQRWRALRISRCARSHRAHSKQRARQLLTFDSGEIRIIIVTNTSAALRTLRLREDNRGAMPLAIGGLGLRFLRGEWRGARAMNLVSV